MKINYCFYGLGKTGGIRVLLTLASKLAERGHDVSITVPQRRFGYFDINKKIKVIQGVVPNIIKILDPLFYIHTRGKSKIDVLYLQSLLLKLGINLYLDIDHSIYNILPETDIQIATFYPTAFPVSISKARAKIYHMQHFETVFTNNEYEKQRALLSYRLPLKRIANSSWLKSKLKHELGVDADYVPWAIDTKIYNTTPVQSNRLEGLFRRENKELYILSLGRSIRWKGLLELINALKYIKKIKPNLNIKLILYGTEPNLKSLYPCEYVYAPSDKELVFLYQNVDMVVIPSWYESFPYPPLEGMACGTKVVTTKYGVEDYAIDGFNAVIAEPQNIKSLAQSIVKTLTNETLGENLKHNGPKTAKKFTWKRTTDLIERIYLKELNKE